VFNVFHFRSRWPCDLRLLDCWYRSFKSRRGHEFSSVVFVVCFIDSGLCDGLVTRPEESYLVGECPTVRDLETSTARGPRPEWGCWFTEEIS